jgi:2-polyprenyl-6-methoxyphenol hydroxylase-like FAD-dependent oxidoreductase
MVYLSEAQRAALARYARSRRQSVAQVIGDAVDRLLASEARPRRRARFAGIASGPKQASLSKHTEEFLREYLRRTSP